LGGGPALLSRILPKSTYVADQNKFQPGSLSEGFESQLDRFVATTDADTRRQIIEQLDQLDRLERIEKCREDFLAFCKAMWPPFIESAHHRQMAKIFEGVVKGTKKRAIINIRPRVGKSELTSWLLPAWFIGKFPHKKIMQVTHTAALATKYGKRVRDLISTPSYQEIFPGVQLKADSKAAGKWETRQGGEYFAAGTDTNLAGWGADLCVIDDPVSEQDGKTGKREVFDKVYDWYTSGPRQRLQPGAAVLVVMTRWHKADLTGRLIQASVESPGADQWELISFPAIIDRTNPDGSPKQLPDGSIERVPLFPELWPMDQVQSAKASMSVGQWNAQFMQNPTSEEGALIKREWWKKWELQDEPDVKSTIMAWDTAFGEKQKANFSAMTLWGVFYTGDEDRPKANLIMLDAWRGRVEFPGLKKKVIEEWKKRSPDVFLVENRATGTPLIYELRAAGIPVSEFNTSHATGDKVVRCNSVTDLFQSGLVWAPSSKDGDWQRWAAEVIEECAEFPNGEYDDYVDTVVMSLMRFRKGGYIRVPADFDEPEEKQHRLRRKYYW
jgi:predicted phage terminase large subunit-like protein